MNSRVRVMQFQFPLWDLQYCRQTMSGSSTLYFYESNNNIDTAHNTTRKSATFRWPTKFILPTWYSPGPYYS